MNIYTPDQNKVLHYVNVDLATRSFIDAVHLVQYDDKLPILAVRMFQNGVNYDAKEASRIQLRYGKRDQTFVIADTLGVSDDGSIAYFELTKQITVEAGEHKTLIDVIYADEKEVTTANGASSSFSVVVDKNPVTDDMIESTIEFKQLAEYRNEALEYKDDAYESAMILFDYLEDNFRYQFVDELPSEPDKKTIYLILKAGETDKYHQWVYGKDNKWHLIGTSQINLDDKVYITSAKLLTNGWGSEYPFSQSVVVQKVMPTSWIFINIHGDAVEKYGITGVSQNVDEITFITPISKPDEDIDVDILVLNNSY